MNIEVGKFYKTRSGLKVRIYATDAGGMYSTHGAVFSSGMWASYSWTMFGKHYDNIEDRYDIIHTWPEEKEVEAWVWLYANGSFILADCPPGPFSTSPHNTSRYRIVGTVHLTGKVIEGKFE